MLKILILSISLFVSCTESDPCNKLCDNCIGVEQCEECYDNCYESLNVE